MMVSDLSEAPVLPKVCPHIYYSNATVFCKGEICHATDHDRFKEEWSFFLLIADEQGELIEKGDNAR